MVRRARVTAWAVATVLLALGALPARAAVGEPAAAASLPFTDLRGVPWALPSVALLWTQGMAAGVAADSSDPEGQLSGGAGLVLLGRLVGPVSAGGAGPAVGSQAWAAARGILQGTFDGAAPVPRARWIVWLARALGLGSGAPPTFADAGAIPAVYLTAVGAAQAAGLTVGYPDGTFRPDRPVTRAEAAVTLARAEWELGMGGAGDGQPFAVRVGSEWEMPRTVTSGTLRVGTADLPDGPVQTGWLRTDDGGADVRYLTVSGGGAGEEALRLGGLVFRAAFRWTALDAQGGEAWYAVPGYPVNALPYLDGGCLDLSPSSPGQELCVQGGSGGVTRASWGDERRLGTPGWTYQGPALPVPVFLAGVAYGGLPPLPPDAFRSCGGPGPQSPEEQALCQALQAGTGG